ncbi:MAG: hypothetical protein O3A00_05320 [Planctomycetota bacterium]|nr:hypothetical protein [Planctomycetota bacterium]
MKKLLTVAVFSMVAGLAANASAGDRFHFTSGPRLFPVSGLFLQNVAPPAPGIEGAQVAPMPQPLPMHSAVGVPLFNCVKYTDVHEMAPCAVPKIIMIKDPCWKPCKKRCGCCDSCSPPPCVAIKICVPPCGCERITCRRDGDRVRYDYGKYAVDVRVKDGYIEVDYQD